MLVRKLFSAAIAALAASAQKTNAQMAAPADASPDTTSTTVQSDDIRQQLNNCVAALRIIAAKLDLDAGVTDVNYFALSCDAAVLTAPKKIKSV